MMLLNQVTTFFDSLTQTRLSATVQSKSKEASRNKVNYSTFRKQRENFWSEAVVWGCSVEKMFLEILQNSQKNTCTRAFF